MHIERFFKSVRLALTLSLPVHSWYACENVEKMDDPLMTVEYFDLKSVSPHQLVDYCKAWHRCCA